MLLKKTEKQKKPPDEKTSGFWEMKSFINSKL